MIEWEIKELSGRMSVDSNSYPGADGIAQAVHQITVFNGLCIVSVESPQTLCSNINTL